MSEQNMEAANADQAEANAEVTKESNAQETKESGDSGEGQNRLLKESKAWKKKAQDLERKLKEVEEAKLKEANDYKALYEKSRKEQELLAQKMMSDKRKLALSNGASKFRVKDLEAVVALGNKELLQYDQDADGFVGVDEFFEDLKTRKPYLFETDKPAVATPARPGGQIKDTPFEQLSFEEKQKKLREKLQASFQK